MAEKFGESELISELTEEFELPPDVTEAMDRLSVTLTAIQVAEVVENARKITEQAQKLTGIVHELSNTAVSKD